MQKLIVARITDGGVLGCMNDVAVLCGHAIGTSGGLRQADLADLNRALRRNINSARGYPRPVDLATRRMHRSTDRRSRGSTRPWSTGHPMQPWPRQARSPSSHRR
jgi:hypothetical protein